MRWAARKIPFARPVHWISALFDGKKLKFEFEGIKAGNTSRGHRFLKPDTFKFDSFKTYLKECKKHKVMVDPAERRQSIKDQIKTLAKQVKGKVQEDAGLLDTVTHLVEYPVAVLGEFDKAYLELPAELLVITMKHHQKYFPVWKGGKLLPYFITISNMQAKGKGKDRRRWSLRHAIPGKYSSPPETTPSLPDVADHSGGPLIPSVLDTTFAGAIPPPPGTARHQRAGTAVTRSLNALGYRENTSDGWTVRLPDESLDCRPI